MVRVDLVAAVEVSTMMLDEDARMDPPLIFAGFARSTLIARQRGAYRKRLVPRKPSQNHKYL